VLLQVIPRTNSLSRTIINKRHFLEELQFFLKLEPRVSMGADVLFGGGLQDIIANDVVVVWVYIAE